MDNSKYHEKIALYNLQRDICKKNLLNKSFQWPAVWKGLKL